MLQFDPAFNWWSNPMPFDGGGSSGPGCIAYIILDCDPPADPGAACDPAVPQWQLIVNAGALAIFLPTPANVECTFTCEPLLLVFNVSWSSVGPTITCCGDFAAHSGTLEITITE